MRAGTLSASVLLFAAVVAAVWALAAPLFGGDVPVPLLVVAGVVLLGAVLAGAALAAVAFARREWAWGLALLVAWPLLVPVYLSRLRARGRSAEAEV